ncbi:hypothetical protein [Spirilliplanes yamanashiensis]|uniref:Uncharacterized protein n=1 Tax=Spirilliplanes yamanashiensis TaxID=42233 RepID=A0A8J3YAZ7_9ACTN|nr:hypothetical protein [Spirilliplanes yamanashiensis]MDP9817860.1 heme exporter protein D [Spirilliplanes yamanashiensis]GIJ04670.1 hypothetical protein Sya03_40220 [Spirilliplanes yamanashiensis]
MVIWIVVGICVLAVLVLGLAVRPVLGRVDGLLTAAERLQRHRTAVLALQARAESLAAGVQRLGERAETVQDRLTVIRAARGKQDATPEFITRRAG